MSEIEYKYPFFDENGKVICQICGKSFLVISPRHLEYKHNVNYAAYTSRYPEAPLSTDEFKAKGKFGKMKNMFADGEKKPKVEELNEIDDLIAESYEDDVADEVDIVAYYDSEKKKSSDPIKTAKNRIYDHLKTYYANIKMDYMVQEFNSDGTLSFEAISDFCDPVLKVVINFPETFWHNRGNFDPLTNHKLKKFGWQVIEIKSNAPSLDKIDSVLENL